MDKLDCPQADAVTLEFLFLQLVFDTFDLAASDTSKEVRKAVAANIGISVITLPSLLARTRDVSEDVRKFVYNVLQIKVCEMAVLHRFGVDFSDISSSSYLVCTQGVDEDVCTFVYTILWIVVCEICEMALLY